MLGMSGPIHFEIYLVLMILFFVCVTFLKRVNASWLQTSALLWGWGGVLMSFVNLSAEGSLFVGSFEVDFYTQFIKTALAIGFLIILYLARGITGGREEEKPEFYLFLTSSLLGLSFLISSQNLLLFYVSLELSSYSLYLLVPMRRSRQLAQEASLKYFLFGAFASGLMLFGLSYLYGVFGSLQFSEIFNAGAIFHNEQLLFVGLLLTLVGLFFKLAVIPFHFWAPDVYEETPAPLTGFIATLSKLAAIAVLLKFVAFGGGIWAPLNALLVILSFLTMTWGNLAAIRQREAKRMLAYSGIAQVGYLLLGVLAWGKPGFSAALFYTLLYLVMTLGAFMVVTLLSSGSKDPHLENFKGLSKRAPLLAFLFLISVFSLAGVPPLAGFTGKWILFKAALDQGYGLLAFWGIINSVISLYYYIVFVKAAYLDEPQSNQATVTLGLSNKLLAYLILLAIILLGIYPTPLLTMAEKAASVLF